MRYVGLILVGIIQLALLGFGGLATWMTVQAIQNEKTVFDGIFALGFGFAAMMSLGLFAILIVIEVALVFTYEKLIVLTENQIVLPKG